MPKPEWLSLIIEIGFDEIDTATSFVEYYCESYGESKSSIWYRLKRLKEMGFLDFAEKGEQPRPLSLTQQGKELLRQSHVRASLKVALYQA
ncbi:MAG: hypothetical protein ACP5T3_02745 [Candidatus Micrarchaeia archaeon]